MGGDERAIPPPDAPMFATLAWPLSNFLKLWNVYEPGTVVVREPCRPWNDLAGHIQAMQSSVRSLLLAYFAIYFVHGGDGADGYPAFGRAKDWDIQWMWPLLVRNLIATWVICGGWDYILYYSRLAPYFKPYKLNPDYPTTSQIVHDGFWTTQASVCATFLEVLLCHWYATG